MHPARPRPRAATVVPLVALCLLAAVALVVVQRVPGTAAGRLHASTQEVAGDLAAGRLTAVWERLDVPARRPEAVRSLQVIGSILRGARYRVLDVDAAAGRSTLLWEGAEAGSLPLPMLRRPPPGARPALGLVLAWRPQGDGTWALADWAWAS